MSEDKGLRQEAPAVGGGEGDAARLADLLARVEAATGEDRDLDGAISRCFDPEANPRPDLHYAAAYRLHDQRLVRVAPKLTASLDAALALVERVRPGAMWSSHPGYEGPNGSRYGQTMGIHIERPVGSHWGNHASPPLALLAALLRSLIDTPTASPSPTPDRPAASHQALPADLHRDEGGE